MKTTLEIPDATFRKAKSEAAANGISLREFVAEALEEKLRKNLSPSTSREPDWIHLVGAIGKTNSQRRETRRVQEIINREFHTIDPEDLD